jgi:hypothetical protein
VTLTDVGDEEPSGRPEGFSGERAELLYANSMAIAAGPFDVTLVFGQQDNAARTESNPAPASTEIVRISMSWAHAKSMIPLLARVVAQYEQQLGEIPAPGFDQNWKA